MLQQKLTRAPRRSLALTLHGTVAICGKSHREGTGLGLEQVTESSYSLGRYAEMSATTVLLVAGSLPGSMTLWYVERRAAP